MDRRTRHETRESPTNETKKTKKMNVQTHLTPSRTIITSFATAQSSIIDDDSLTPFERGDWVIGINICGTISAVALSNGMLQLYDMTSWQNTHTIRTGYHVTDIALLLSNGNTLLLASTTEGRVLMYDLREKSSPTIQLPALITTATTVYDMPPRQSQHTNRQHHGSEAALCLSVGYNGAILAVGTDKARIHFYNLQNPLQSAYLTSFVDSHQKQVITLEFCGPSNSILLTGSEDGLLNIFDTSKATEEMALETVCSVQRPVRKAGFYRDNMIYCLTSSETVALWDAETGVCCYDSGDSLRSDLVDILIASSSAGGSMPSIDYLIDVSTLENAQGEPHMLLMAGNLRGDAYVFRWNSFAEDKAIAVWQFQHCFSGGHAGVIRAFCIVSSPTGAETDTGFVTGGEDARICLWNQERQPRNANKTIRLPAARRQARPKSSSASPY